jgi:hypothetical protein
MKFSIRDLLLVTVIVALAVGWWVDRRQLAKENDRLESRERLRNMPTPPMLPTYPETDPSKEPNVLK